MSCPTGTVGGVGRKTRRAGWIGQFRTADDQRAGKWRPGHAGTTSVAEQRRRPDAPPTSGRHEPSLARTASQNCGHQVSCSCHKLTKSGHRRTSMYKWKNPNGTYRNRSMTVVGLMLFIRMIEPPCPSIYPCFHVLYVVFFLLPLLAPLKEPFGEQYGALERPTPVTTRTDRVGHPQRHGNDWTGPHPRRLVGPGQATSTSHSCSFFVRFDLI